MVKDIKERPCGHMIIRDSRDIGCKEAYLHFTDGMEIWRYAPAWKGWKLMTIIDASGREIE